MFITDVEQNTHKNTRALALVWILLAGSFAGSANAGINQWTSNGPGVPIITAFAIDPLAPAILYAGTGGGGVFKSTDGGASWQPMNTGLSSNSRTLAIDPLTPATLYAGTFNRGVFKSTDGGASWQPMNTGLTVFDVRALAIDPVTPATVYAGTNGGGVFKITFVEGGTPAVSLSSTNLDFGNNIVGNTSAKQ